MITIRTKREAHCVLGLLVSGSAFVTAGAIAQTLNIPQSAVKASIHGIEARLADEHPRAAFIMHRAGYGWTIQRPRGKTEEPVPRSNAAERHPDKGGSDAMMAELNKARDDARRERA